MSSLDPDVRYFTNSEAWTWRRCRRRWYLSFYRKLEPVRTTFSGPMPIGTRIHKALEAEYSPGATATALEMYTFVVTEERAILENEGLTEDEWKQYEKDIELSRRMIEGFEEWRAETGCDAGLEITGVEEKVTVPSGVQGVALLGKLDVRGEFKTDGRRMFIDHKSVQSLDYDGSRVTQFKHYMLLELLWLHEQYPDLPYEELPVSSGVALNLIRKVKRTAAAKPPFYRREWVYHSFPELRAYYKQLHGIINDVITTEQMLNAGADSHLVCYPTPDFSCSWQCQFYDVCGLMDDPASDAEGYISRYLRMYDPSERYAAATDEDTS